MCNGSHCVKFEYSTQKKGMQMEIVQVNLDRLDHQAMVLQLLEAYSMDDMGDRKPLSDYSRTNVIEGLRRHPTTLVVLAMENGEPVGLAVCFRGFSTFAARPLINIHDFFVKPECRGKGIGQAMLVHLDAIAHSTGCCKLTLEVQQSNHRARRIYERFGFRQAVYAADAEAGGGSWFMTKPMA